LSGTRVKKNIIKERVKAFDFNSMNLQFSCENCSFFMSTSKTCNLGYNTKPHLHENQVKLYEQSGRLTFCRFLEID